MAALARPDLPVRTWRLIQKRRLVTIQVAQLQREHDRQLQQLGAVGFPYLNRHAFSRSLAGNVVGRYLADRLASFDPRRFVVAQLQPFVVLVEPFPVMHVEVIEGHGHFAV
jgi:hypothetical protein